jgi:hypothetical protein
VSSLIKLDCSVETRIGYFQPVDVKKAILIAVSTLMFLGMILSYAIGAPWYVIVGFFLLTMSPLFPLGKAVDDQRSRIIE